MKLVNKFKRGVLGEGKNFQLGFTLCKKRDKETLDTLYAISPCKDYLNDVVFAEATGKPCSAYGLHASKQDAFKEGVFLAFKICMYPGNQTYAGYDKDKENLNSNILNVLKYINTFEKLLKIKDRTEYIPIDEFEDIDKNKEQVYVFKLPADWVQGTYLISTCSLLIRIAQWYDGEMDVLKYAKTFKANAEDMYLMSSAYPKVEQLAQIGIKPQDMSKLSGGSGVHNLGILSYQL